MLEFNDLLAIEGIDPGEVRLLRHETKIDGRSPYALWRDDPAGFGNYQRTQKISRRGWFAAPHWASFVVTPERETLFVGLYEVGRQTDPLPLEWVNPLTGSPLDPAVYELHKVSLGAALSDLAGRLLIDWAAGTRSWVQHSAGRIRPVIEITRAFREPDFPGHLNLVSSLSELARMPKAWRAALGNARGIYLLACPRTGEQYVGMAAGPGGFLARWGSYLSDGHGGNVALKSREPSDYQVSILELAGSAATPDEIGVMESLWKIKLQSRAMGLNRNG